MQSTHIFAYSKSESANSQELKSIETTSKSSSFYSRHIELLRMSIEARENKVIN